MSKPKNYHEDCNPGTIHIVDENNNCSGCEYARFMEEKLIELTKETE